MVGSVTSIGRLSSTLKTTRLRYAQRLIARAIVGDCARIAGDSAIRNTGRLGRNCGMHRSMRSHHVGEGVGESRACQGVVLLSVVGRRIHGHQQGQNGANSSAVAIDRMEAQIHLRVLQILIAAQDADDHTLQDGACLQGAGSFLPVR